MKIGFPSFAVFLVVAGTSTLRSADNCDCSHFPIKPKGCATTCANTRLEASVNILNDLTRSSDRGVPKDLLTKAKCVVVIPGTKGSSFLSGAQGGHGFAACRRVAGPGWTAPAAIRIDGGNAGFQTGGSDSDIVLLVTNESGRKHLFSDKFTLGGDASAAAGPVGRDAAAQTDAQLHTEVLSYSRSRGVFSGMAVEGMTLRADPDTNEGLYGTGITVKEILGGQVKSTPAEASLEGTLNRNMRTE
jgi:SH3 domain-containing YSC84-like protein 1